MKLKIFDGVVKVVKNFKVRSDDGEKEYFVKRIETIRPPHCMGCNDDGLPYDCRVEFEITTRVNPKEEQEIIKQIRESKESKDSDDLLRLFMKDSEGVKDEVEQE